MGLLDDAIRDHLDLKRRHGATEDEIARKEAEALGPVRRVVSREDEGADGEDFEAAIPADPDFRASESPVAEREADPHDLYAPEESRAADDPAASDLGWDAPDAPRPSFDDETRVLRGPDSEQPLEDDYVTRVEPAATDEPYEDERGWVEPDAATEQPDEEERTRLRPAPRAFDGDAADFERPTAREPRLARVDDEPFADGEPAAVPPPEETRASVEPDAADVAPSAYGEPYDPLDPLFEAAPEPESASSAGSDWVSRPTRADEETPLEEPPLSHGDATPARAAYRAGEAPVDESSDAEWIDTEPSERDGVEVPEDADTAFPRADEPPRRAGPGGSRAAGSVDAAPSTQQGDAPDVLEETPEFLQETPEHDRLWFEQRPPRDFDFDE